MIGKDLDHAAALLRKGELVAIPTETVYGLAGNALAPETAARIFAVKDRPAFDPLIIHTSSVERLTAWTFPLAEPLRLLAERFMPGPLTLLTSKRPIVPDLVTAGSPLVAVRIPAHPLTRTLLETLDFPLAAPSANPFGYISPTTAAHVARQLGDKIPYILDGGPCLVGLESTIVGLEDGQVTVFRKGGVPVEDIEALIGVVQVKVHSSSNPLAPGMLRGHYAPKAPLLLGDLRELQAAHPDKKIGVLAFRQGILPAGHPAQILLSPSGKLQEAAQGLFAAMRRLDEMDLEVILAELLPEEGLGRAINDRLRRAAYRE